MRKAYQFSELQKLLVPAQKALVFIPKNPTFDQIAAALAIFLSLEKMEKKVSILCPEPMTVEFSHLVGVDKIKDFLGKEEGLVVTLDYPIENIEKVSYNDDGGKLNLVIKPKSGSPPIQPEKVIFSSQKTQEELIFSIGARKPEGLGKFYQSNPSLFQEGMVVNIDNNSQNNQFGKINFVDPEVSSCSEIVVSILEALRLPFNEDIGSNLLLGLERETQNFTSPMVNADTFEAAALCLRAGGRREKVVLEKEKKEEEHKVEKGKAPSEWLGPKIYKGSTLP